jgi:hypothetical protein
LTPVQVGSAQRGDDGGSSFAPGSLAPALRSRAPLPSGNPSASSPGRDDRDDEAGAGRVTDDPNGARATLWVRVQHNASRVRSGFQRPCWLEVCRTRVTAAAVPDVLGVLLAPPQPLVTSDIVPQRQTNGRAVAARNSPWSGPRPLRAVLLEFIEQYNTHRPTPISWPAPASPVASPALRRDGATTATRPTRRSRAVRAGRLT